MPSAHLTSASSQTWLKEQAEALFIIITGKERNHF